MLNKQIDELKWSLAALMKDPLTGNQADVDDFLTKLGIKDVVEVETLTREL